MTFILASAKTLQRRMETRVRYRRVRDRKIAVDLLGKWFEMKYQPPLPNMAVRWFRWQLTGYDPKTAVVRFRSDLFGDTIPMSSDDFWSRYKTGSIRDAS